MGSERRFGYQWEKYSAMAPEYEEQFRLWTNLGPEDVRGKRVLDAGCGMGRNSYWPALWGAKEVLAFDNDDHTLASARTTLAQFPAAHVEQHDLESFRAQEIFDIAFSIGVIHHLRRPRAALENLVRSLAPGGYFIVWVYSYEGNEWIVRFISPLRKMITSRLPAPLLRVLALCASLPLYAFVKVVRGPTDYLRQLAGYPFSRVHLIVFDQLIPEIAHYWKRDEVAELAEGLPLRDVTIEHPKNGMGWILSGQKI